MGRRRWTADLLKEHYDTILSDRDQDTARTAGTMDARLQAHNDLLNRFVTKDELAAIKPERFVTKDELRAARAELRAYVLVGATIAGAVAAWVRFR